MLVSLILTLSHYVLVCDGTDFDECVVSNGGCGPLAVCTNTPGSFTCTCTTGFNPTGRHKSNANSVFLSMWSLVKNTFSKRCEIVKAALVLCFSMSSKYILFLKQQVVLLRFYNITDKLWVDRNH